jgi:hypothetical protein
MKLDLRKYSRQTTIRLILGGFLILFLIGDGLVYFIYGPAAAISGFVCLGAGLLPVLIIMGALWVMEYVVKKNREN